VLHDIEERTMATIEWTFLLMNLVPGRGQTFIDRWLAKVFPASAADGFQSIATEEAPQFPQALRIQWSNYGNDERLLLATRVLLLRFHVKLLLSLILSTLLLVVFIFIPPIPLFMFLSSAIVYILAICSYSSFASWLIITEKSIFIAVPSWRYKWAIHLNLLFPQISNLLAKPYEHYSFHKYDGRLIERIETPTFNDGSCKILLDYKSGFHLMNETVIMDHFASISNIRSALSRLDIRTSGIEGGAGDSNSENPSSSSSESPRLPSHIADEMHAADYGQQSRVKPRSD
jgi:hypothetical protein